MGRRPARCYRYYIIRFTQSIAFVTHHHKTSGIIMAEIVLDYGITTIVIRIESLPVPFGILSAYLIKLDNRVITTPGPDTGSGIFYPQKIRTIPHYIMFYQCTVAGA